MGNNSSIPERIEQNKQFLPDDENKEEGFNSKTDENEEKHEITADYIFTETENLKSLPPLDHPIKVINNPLFTNPDILKQHKEKLNNNNIQKLETIHDQVIDILSDKSDIIIDEYDFNTLISLIITLTENSNILIISPNSHIGQIYEYFNDKSSNIGLITNNLTKTENSNIIDILLLDTIKLDQYHFFIFMIDENIPKLLIEQSLRLISSKKKQIILYRIFPSHGYADDIIFHVFSDVPKHLNAIQTKSSKCSTNSHINFENCINLTFNSIEEANKLIKTSAYKQGFEISVKDSLKTKENRIRYNCKNKSCPFSIYLKKKHDKIYIKKCDSRSNHDLTPEITQYKLLTSKQVRLILSLKRNKVPLIEINKTLNDIYNININVTNNQIRKMKRKGKLNIDKLETKELEENTLKKRRNRKNKKGIR